MTIQTKQPGKSVQCSLVVVQANTDGATNVSFQINCNEYVWNLEQGKLVALWRLVSPNERWNLVSELLGPAFFHGTS